MRRQWRLAGPWMAIGSAAAVIAGLVLGEPVPRPLLLLLPAVVIAWSLIVLAEYRTERLLRQQIRYQQETISAQIEVIGQLQQLLYIVDDHDG